MVETRLAYADLMRRRAAHDGGLFLGFSDTAFARILAEAAYGYFIKTGEAHRDAPKIPLVQGLISDFDGSTEAEDRIRGAYYAFFVGNPPPPKFLKYAAELLKEGSIGYGEVRRDRTTVPTQLRKVKNLTPEELADAAMQYVFNYGEGHPDAPSTPGIRRALSANDGSDGAVRAVREAYRAAFVGEAPSEAFLRYAEGLVRTNQIVRRKG